MKQESITMIGNDIDDMAYDEYLNDEVHDIKTTAIEISATNRPLADKRRLHSLIDTLPYVNSLWCVYMFVECVSFLQTIVMVYELSLYKIICFY